VSDPLDILQEAGEYLCAITQVFGPLYPAKDFEILTFLPLGELCEMLFS
jgi:hypothetical protein